MHTKHLEAIIDERHRLENEQKAIKKRILELDRDYIQYGAKFEIGDLVKDDLGRIFKVVQCKIKNSSIYPTRLLIVYGCQMTDHDDQPNNKIKFYSEVEFFNDYELTKSE